MHERDAALNHAIDSVAEAATHRLGHSLEVGSPRYERLRNAVLEAVREAAEPVGKTAVASDTEKTIASRITFARGSKIDFGEENEPLKGFNPPSDPDAPRDYVPMESIFSSAFGSVAAALDEATGKKAIKGTALYRDIQDGVCTLLETLMFKYSLPLAEKGYKHQGIPNKGWDYETHRKHLIGNAIAMIKHRTGVRFGEDRKSRNWLESELLALIDRGAEMALKKQGW